MNKKDYGRLSGKVAVVTGVEFAVDGGWCAA